MILDGSASNDADGDSLCFSWVLETKPQGSDAALDDPAAAVTHFTADLAGAYVARLTANDGIAESDPDQVTINAARGNTPPVANAGPDQSVHVGDAVILDGSASSDVDGDALTYQWTLTNKPVQSGALLQDPTSVQTTFVADVVGQYITQLIVYDGSETSDPDTVILNIEAGNTPPVADAGADQSVYVGDTVTLDGSASSDADGDALTYHWSITVQPANSTANLSDPAASNPTFSVDQPGDYIVQLIVNDATVDSPPDQVMISTLNSRPVADAGTDRTLTVGSTIELDGSASNDADQDPLTYQWTPIRIP